MESIWKFTCKNGQEVTLRPAVPEDAQQIIDTITSVGKERSYILTDKFKKSEIEERTLITELDTATSLLLVAENEEKIIGGLGVSPSGAGRHYKASQICEVGIHLIASAREQGLGSKFLEYAIDWAREKGYKKISACIFTSNKRSLNLFKKYGFIQEGKRQQQFRLGNEYIDEVVMGKILY